MDESGPLNFIVVGVGYLSPASVAITAIRSGRSLWSPTVPGLRNYAVRLFGAIASLGLVWLFAASRAKPPPVNFVSFALWSGGLGLAGALLYLFLRIWLTFHCEGDRTLFVRGFALKKNASLVLQGKLDGLPPQYGNLSGPHPTSERDYFCNSGKQPDFLWEPWSYASALVVIVASYGTAMVPLTLALASGSIALSRSM